ncbi:MAG: excalibur calcium-binding domain-containing protein [Williamsia herbipolensis]|uniref:excalibur calcium-binding domain-containing protein n=1 Tax=uncultured Williamsia sp. TaxID=259311 RepID=UPI0019DD92D0|nr:excalibur calcium-binding domain-containing protein [uncultured Williamsia sp.]MBE7159677.1 excalibur calcium-binding domain-containing protein [Williamsia herbipolensis]
MTTTIRRVVVALAMFGAALASVAVAAPASAQTYANCKALNADHPHGVGTPGAVDSTSGRPVTTFEVDATLYEQNRKSDRDGDGIACEKR